MTIDLCKGLAKRFESVEIVVNELVGEFVEEAQKTIRLHSLQTYAWLPALTGFKRYCRDHKPDIVFAQGTRMSILASLAVLLPGHRPELVWCLHNPYSSKYSLFPRPIAWLLTRFVALLASQPARIIGVSNGVCESFLAFAGAKFRRKTLTLYNPVPQYSGKPFVPSGVKQKKQIIAVGRLVLQKNFALLIEAMPAVLAQVDCALHIYGNGPMRQSLQDLIATKGLEKSITLEGYASGIREKMAQSDLFVLSSSWEGLPMVLLEAMTTGVPVVSTNCVSGPDEILEGGKWGLLVPPDDRLALGGAMIKVLKHGGVDPRLRARDFEPEIVIGKYLALIRTICGDRTRQN